MQTCIKIETMENKDPKTTNEAFNTLIKTRRTTRKFKDEIPPRELKLEDDHLAIIRILFIKGMA